jgi:hypothetical protein
MFSIFIESGRESENVFGQSFQPIKPLKLKSNALDGFEGEKTIS